MSYSMLDCKQVIELVTDYLEGSMEADERLQFERHVAICPPCRAFLGQMRETIRISGELKEEQLSPEARQGLIDAFRHWRDSA